MPIAVMFTKSSMLSASLVKIRFCSAVGKESSGDDGLLTNWNLRSGEFLKKQELKMIGNTFKPRCIADSKSCGNSFVATYSDARNGWLTRRIAASASVMAVCISACQLAEG